MWNQCEFIGNMGNDPETRSGQSGSPFTTFSIAVNKPGDRDAKPLWVNVTCFGKTAEFVSNYLKKGTSVLVQGSIELQEYEGKDGKPHSSLKLVAGRVLSLSKREGQASGAAATATSDTKAPAVIHDEDIPF